MPRKYSNIYLRLVGDKGDIIGHIAYALYKEDKIEYISRFKKEHNGKDLDEDDLKPFNEISSTDNSIARYRYIASRILQSFLDNTLEETKIQIEEELNKNHIELIREAIKPITPPSKLRGFIQNIIQSVLGALAFTLIMCTFVFIADLSTHKYSFTIGGDGDTKIEQVNKAHSDTINKCIIIRK